MSAATFDMLLPLATDHPALAGHFPGHPIYPGVVLLDAAVDAIEVHYGMQVLGLPVAKFLAPVRPGMVLTLHAERRVGDVRFELATADGTRVASGSARLQTEPEGAPS